jgi:hypothetical protein
MDALPVLEFRCETHVGEVLWPADGRAVAAFDVGPVDYDALPLPADLVERLEALAQWFDGSYDWDYPPLPSPWRQDECDRFNSTARALFVEVQEHLRDIAYLVYDMPELTEDPERDEYLRDPAAYGRRHGITMGTGQTDRTNSRPVRLPQPVERLRLWWRSRRTN